MPVVTNRLNIGISKILKGTSGNSSLLDLVKPSLLTTKFSLVVLPAVVLTGIVLNTQTDLITNASNLISKSESDTEVAYYYSLNSFYNDISQQQEDEVNTELRYAEPPSSFDLIEDMLTAQDAMKMKVASSNNKAQLKKGETNSISKITLKNVKEVIDVSGPYEPQVVYDSILSPQSGESFERNPFDTEAPDTFF